MQAQINGSEAINATANRAGATIANLLAELGARDAEVAALRRHIAQLEKRVSDLEKPPEAPAV